MKKIEKFLGIIFTNKQQIYVINTIKTDIEKSIRLKETKQQKIIRDLMNLLLIMIDIQYYYIY